MPVMHTEVILLCFISYSVKRTHRVISFMLNDMSQTFDVSFYV